MRSRRFLDSLFILSTVDRKSTRLNSSHTEISPLSLHDALPIYRMNTHQILTAVTQFIFDQSDAQPKILRLAFYLIHRRSEEHTSELQSHRDLPSFPTRRSSDLSDEYAPDSHRCNAVHLRPKRCAAEDS